ncbi:hypothetical protein Pmani_034159 [Petrolisthes manimaculis]|uniref:Uncharacterized protein n=1 Tax=Petrolisthes manimaculis TaxID=1843537 RepID=A0AAE1NPU2_9EUCA|nr:hypothetical protein Pmani_034159 [Petrolisthes manimaculis]
MLVKYRAGRAGCGVAPAGVVPVTVAEGGAALPRPRSPIFLTAIVRYLTSPQPYTMASPSSGPLLTCRHPSIA